MTMPRAVWEELRNGINWSRAQELHAQGVLGDNHLNAMRMIAADTNPVITLAINYPESVIEPVAHTLISDFHLPLDLARDLSDGDFLEFLTENETGNFFLTESGNELIEQLLIGYFAQRENRNPDEPPVISA